MKLFPPYLLITASLVAASSTSYASDIGFMLKVKNSYETREHEWSQQEWLLDIEYVTTLGPGDLNAITRLRWDTLSDVDRSQIDDTYSEASRYLWSEDKADISIREFYWDMATANGSLRIGKQQVVWGKADGLKLLDVINPQSFDEFILDEFDDSRIPLWMVNAQWFVGGNGAIQVLWIPDTTSHEMPVEESPFNFTSPVNVPQPVTNAPIVLNDIDLPASNFKNSDVGIRFTDFKNGWDYSLNYLYHYVDFLVLSAKWQTDHIEVNQSYERSHLLGGSASTAVSDWIFRTELTYETDQYFRTNEMFPGVISKDQVSALIGFDWQGWTDQLVSVQWLHSEIIDPDPGIILDQRSDTFTFLWQSNFFNETLKFEWLHIHSINNGDGVAQPKLSYNLESNQDIYIGMDNFYGDTNQLFGQFERADRITIGFEWGY